MKSIAELKRNAKTKLYEAKMVLRNGSTDIPEKLQGWRKIVNANSNSIFLLNNEGKESELPIGRASLVEYDGNNLTLYNAGYRDLNDGECKVMDEWQEHCKTKEYKQKENIDRNIDTSMSYWEKLAFLEKRNMEHLMGTDKKCGLIYIARLNKVQDDSIKGDICMKYEIRKTEETKTI